MAECSAVLRGRAGIRLRCVLGAGHEQPFHVHPRQGAYAFLYWSLRQPPRPVTPTAELLELAEEYISYLQADILEHGDNYGYGDTIARVRATLGRAKAE